MRETDVLLVNPKTGETMVADHYRLCELKMPDGFVEARGEILRLIPSWIAVEDRMPGTGVDVLAFGTLGHDGELEQRICRFPQQDGTAGWDEPGGCGCGHSEDAVTHWMPLPEPPGS